MLRDGAAWYALPEKSAQDKTEGEEYLSIEAQARTEKRGVWGVENLKAAWEFRAERAELQNREEQAKRAASMPQTISETKASTIVKSKKKTFVNVSMWSNIGDTETASPSDLGSNLFSGTVPNSNLSYLGTRGNS